MPFLLVLVSVIMFICALQCFKRTCRNRGPLAQLGTRPQMPQGGPPSVASAIPPESLPSPASMGSPDSNTVKPGDELYKKKIQEMTKYKDYIARAIAKYQGDPGKARRPMSGCPVYINGVQTSCVRFRSQ